jgi:hypothetical protein
MSIELKMMDSNGELRTIPHALLQFTACLLFSFSGFIMLIFMHLEHVDSELIATG